MLRMINKNKETALHEAARNKRSLGVVKAIMSNEDPNEFKYSANYHGETPLYLAVKNRNMEIAFVLLIHPDSECLAYGGPNGKTALHEATVLDFEDDDFTNKTVPDFEDDDLTIKGLREQLWQKSSSGIKNDKDDAQSQIGPKEQLWKKFKSSLCIKNNKDDAQSQIGPNSEPKEQLWKKFKSSLGKENDKDDAQSQIEHLIQFMLIYEMRKLTKEIDEKGWTPLHYAVYTRKRLAVKFLLDIDISSAYIADKDWKRTALHIAACRGFQYGMEEIISVCPNICEITDIRGWNVIHCAVISKNDEVLKAVLKNSSLIYLLNEKDVKGNTPVHLYKACHPRLPSFIQHGDTDMFKHWRTLHKQIQNERDFPLKKNEILAWMKDLGTGPLGKIEMQNIEGSKTKENMILKFEKVKDSHLVAAALIATVTFAAMFTVPGGYVSDENNLKKGTPILSGNSAFTAFMISDTIAMVLSTSCVFIHFILVMLGYLERYYWLIRCAFSFLFYAMLAMVITFVTGAYAVLAPSIGYGICVIGLSFSYFIFYSIMRVTWSLFLSADDDEEEVNQYKHQIKTFSWLTGGIFWLGFLFIALYLKLQRMCKKFSKWRKEQVNRFIRYY
ncbi:ankyrin repeat-containing protein At5g02620 isoform X2 [Hevea brasiliensis]|uniref:ankyrin repeat-containing protein At5g02620 isoform X2 n=1 Tax=Hevea brasiliensis TaxID=3981 RepID=UPI0025F70F3D|nr:ankyrin repeat-containing protein At5g02620 isoform X2 [Hevea brasiliensis]